MALFYLFYNVLRRIQSNNRVQNKTVGTQMLKVHGADNIVDSKL